MTKLLTFAACVLFLTTIAFADVASGFWVSITLAIFVTATAVVFLVAALLIFIIRRKRK